jgi:hypothetical protein
MSAMIINILVKLGMSLVTETFISRTVVQALWSLAKNTSNELDNQLVKNVADALKVELPK